MSDLVHGHRVEAHRVALAADAGDHRILHSAAARHAVHRRHVGVGIRPQIPREKIDRVLRVARGVAPCPGAPLRTVQRVDASAVRTPVGVGIASGSHRRIPQIRLRGAEGEIPHVLRVKAPRQAPIDSSKRRPAYSTILIANDAHDVGAAGR